MNRKNILYILDIVFIVFIVFIVDLVDLVAVALARKSPKGEFFDQKIISPYPICIMAPSFTAYHFQTYSESNAKCDIWNLSAKPLSMLYLLYIFLKCQSPDSCIYAPNSVNKNLKTQEKRP